MNKELWSMFESYRVAAFFAGHHHYYHRMKVPGITGGPDNHTVWQITSGGAGAPYYPRPKGFDYHDDSGIKLSREFHYILVHIDRSVVRCEVKNTAGITIDEFVVRN